MATPNFLTLDNIKKMRRLRSSGYSFDEIGKAFGTNNRIAFYHTNHISPKFRKNKGSTRLTAKQIKTVICLRKQGLSVCELARMFDKTSVGIFLLLKRNKSFKRLKNR